MRITKAKYCGTVAVHLVARECGHHFIYEAKEWDDGNIDYRGWTADIPLQYRKQLAQGPIYRHLKYS